VRVSPGEESDTPEAIQARKQDQVTGPAKPWVTPTWGGQAELRAVAIANPEQASRDELRVPTHPFYGEGHASQRIRDALWLDPPGYGEQHAAKVARSTWEIRTGRGRDPKTGQGPVVRAEVGEAHGTDEAGNDGGGTGPHFWVLGKRARIGGLT
jgi:hypothetical protein